MPDTENMNQEAENELDDNQVEAEETDELEDDKLFSSICSHHPLTITANLHH